MNGLYPLKLSYLAKSTLWGGERLKNYGKVPSDDNIAETWELAVRDKENSVILNGEAEGKTLKQYLEENGISFRRFPLLVKFIDAKDDLSVQVHPDDVYAAKNEKDPGKTEMWVILEAEPGASLIYGLKDGKTAEDFARAVQSGDYASVLHQTEVHPGEVWFIPSGMPHAIGKGVLLAEIQQNSDTTYRVYDYDRRDKNGNLRELHIQKAKDVVRPFTRAEVESIRFAGGKDTAPRGTVLLADSAFFKVSLYPGGEKVDLSPSVFMHLLAVDGKGTLTFGEEKMPLTKGDSVFLPQGVSVSLEGDVQTLISEPKR
ncbi:MAG: class I mannose-6-phosphate isomerase [Clostridia bacterium]|nr:class I mannose-6-phosphate isomerase [Clostridia bacterium]